MTRKLCALFLVFSLAFYPLNVFAQSGTNPSYYVICPLGGVNGTLAACTAPASTYYTTIPGDSVGLDFNFVEALLDIDAASGTVTTCTLDVSIQSSMDNFVTTPTIKTVLSFTQIAAGTITPEVKQARRSTTTPVFFGKYQRLKVVATAPSGSPGGYRGRVFIGYSHD